MQILSSYKSPKTDVRQSPIEGKGRFAKENIKKGEIVVIRSGHIISEKQLIAKIDIIGDSDLQIADNFYLVPLTKKEFENVVVFVNHSCKPNLGIMGNVIFVAMRDIRVGEELCLDYAMVNNNDRNGFKCNCKTKSCRKMITGKAWQIKDLQEKYGNYFSSYILEKIKKVPGRE